MNLALDLGNTTARLYIYKGAKRIAKRVFKEFDAKALELILKEHTIDASILSSVVEYDKAITDLLGRQTKFTKLTYRTPLPIENLYETPKTLGTDRIACAVAGAFLYPEKNVLVIDAGTCIKYDFVNHKNKYIGGHITPGFQMRFDALAHFTDKLPELDAEAWGDWEIGTDTELSMYTGIYNSIVYEMEGFIKDYNEKFKQLIVILTGGDARYFVRELNFTIFAEPELIGIGLNEILLFNLHK